MTGFTSETFAFLGELKANNCRDWFEDNRDRYEAHWRAPALDFIAALAGPMSEVSPKLIAVPKLNGSLRRISRDTRFSKDKTPYSPSLHMIFWAGDHPNRSAGMHFVLHPGSVGYGAGRWGFAGPTLAAYRDRVVGAGGDALLAALDQAAAVGCTMDEPALARVPRGFDGAGPRANLLRHKGVVARTIGDGANPSVVQGAGALDWAMGVTRSLMPLIAWAHELP
jgi:uncharacterized protein (TIGR02453 family)